MNEYDELNANEFDDWSDEAPTDYDDMEYDVMANEVIECPRCGESIYEDSEQCPNCLEYIVSGSSTEWSSFTKVVIWLVIISLVLPAILVAINLL